MTAHQHIHIRDARQNELESIALLLKGAYDQYSRLMPSDAWDSYLQDIMDVTGRLSES